MIMFICATANIFSFVVTRQQVPAKLSSLILGVTDNWVVILLIINVILLINGCFMETTASTYIYTPILFPLISALASSPRRLASTSSWRRASTGVFRSEHRSNKLCQCLSYWSLC